MAEPTSALSFYDLILRVAREAGIAYHGSDGEGRATIPVDEHDIDLCKEIVNDGIRMFIADAPPKGWRWMRRIISITLTATRVTGTADDIGAGQMTDLALATTYDDNDDLNDWWIYILTGTGAGCFAQITDYNGTTGRCDIDDWLDAYGNPSTVTPAIGDTFCITPVETVGGDISRYPLAENFGGEVNGQIHYQEDTSHSAIIEWCDEAYIRAERAVTVSTGYPRWAAIRPLEFYAGGTGPKRRWELILDRNPVAADVLEFPYTLYFDKLQLETGDINTPADTSIYDDSIGALWPNDYFNGWTIYIMSGRGRGNYAVVTDYVGASGKFEFTKWLSPDGSTTGTTPDTDSVYYVEPPGNLHPAGLRFDEAIKAACLAQAEMEIEDVTAGFAAKYNQKDLLKAYQTDVRSAPRKLGSMNRGERHIRERTWSDIDTTHIADHYW